MADKNKINMDRKRKLYTSRWTEKETHDLIDLRIKRDPLFKRKNVVPTTLWEKLAEDLNISKGGKECSKKWKNLMQKYKNLKEPPTGQGHALNKVNSENWPFFSKINDFIGGQHNIAPSVLIQSIPDDDIEYLDEELTTACTDTPLTNTPSTNTPLTNALDDLFVDGVFVADIPSTDTPSTSRSFQRNNKENVRPSRKNKDAVLQYMKGRDQGWDYVSLVLRVTSYEYSKLRMSQLRHNAIM